MKMSDATNTNKYIIMWDCYGLESCVDVTEDFDRANQFDKESIFERIKDPENLPVNQSMVHITRTINMMQMRARFNPQRNYEIYYIAATEGITEESIRDYFDDNPQGAADVIRERGTKLWSDRSTTERVIK